jgi:hypothetical protein
VDLPARDARLAIERRQELAHPIYVIVALEEIIDILDAVHQLLHKPFPEYLIARDA